MSLQFKTLMEARINGAKKYNTGKPCRNGHLSERYASTGSCVECLKLSKLPGKISVNCRVHPDDADTLRLFVQALNEVRKS